MKNLEQVLEKVKIFFDANRSIGGEKPYWVLYTNSTENSRGKKIAKNFEVDDNDDSRALLVEQVENLLPEMNQYFSIELKTSTGDKDPSYIVYQNPFFVPKKPQYQQQQQGIYGMGMGQGMQGGGGDMYQLFIDRERMLEKLYEEKLQREKERLESERDLDYLKDEIENIKNHQKSGFEKISGLLESPAIAGFIATILGGVAANMVTPKGQPQVQTTQPQQVKQEPEEQGDYQDETEKLGEDLRDLENVFPGESLRVISELAELAKKNPEILKQFRPTIKQMAHGKG
jgi:hypothetical protein